MLGQKMCEHYKLNPRQTEIALLVLDGYSNRAIGEEIFICENAVKYHLTNIYKICNVANRLELLKTAMAFENIKQGEK